MSFEILTDTSSNLPTELLHEHRIGVIPFSYFIKEKEYSCVDTAGFDGEKFYKAMRLGAKIHTSQINPQNYTDFFETYLKEGKDILFISMSSGISGSFHCAELAGAELSARYPDRKIRIIDTLGASLGEGLLVLKAVEYREKGYTLEKTFMKIDRERRCMYQVFTVDDLMYLKNTGRVKGSTAIVGNMLQIKPLLKGNENGEIVNFAKAIGRKKAIDMMAQRYHLLVREPESQVVGIAHADCEEDANLLKNLISRRKPPKEVMTVMYEPVTGSHVGPGTLALFFMGDSDVRER